MFPQDWIQVIHSGPGYCVSDDEFFSVSPLEDANYDHPVKGCPLFHCILFFFSLATEKQSLKKPFKCPCSSLGYTLKSAACKKPFSVSHIPSPSSVSPHRRYEHQPILLLPFIYSFVYFIWFYFSFISMDLWIPPPTFKMVWICPDLANLALLSLWHAHIILWALSYFLA